MLSAASVGASSKEVLDQSNCFLFTGETLVTFNSEVFAITKNPLPGVQGAVPYRDFLDMVQKFPDDTLEVDMDGEEIRLSGKRRKAGLVISSEIRTPFDSVPKPGGMAEIPPEFMGSLIQAAHTCGSDENKPFTMAVHVTPEMVEACDLFRLFRASFQTGVHGDIVVPASAIRSIASISFHKASVKDGWLHLRSKKKHRVSVRCLSDGNYPNLTETLEVRGKPTKVKLPENLKEIISRAEVMQDSGLGKESLVSVTIDKGKLSIRAKKNTGWYRESQKVKYKGRKLAFQVHPKLLQEVFTKARNVTVDGNRMRIKDGDTTFLVVLEA